MNDDTRSGNWYPRTVDLSPFAGKTVAALWVNADVHTPAGTWDSYFADVVVLGGDGSVLPLYTGQSAVSLGYFGGAGATNTSAAVFQYNTINNPSWAPGDTYYYYGDHLASTRLFTNGNGWPLTGDIYYPFGLQQAASLDQNNYKFTGLERDAESSLDHAQFRQYAYLEGRWTSPDPYDGSYDATNPQSFNRYAYVLNNPLSFIDPSGLDTGADPCGYAPDGTPTYCTNTGSGSGGSQSGGITGCWWCMEYGENSWPTGNPEAWQFLATQKNQPTPKPTPPVVAPSNPCSISQRAELFGNGVLNLALAAGKITAAGAVEAGTSGIGTALALYGAYNAAGNLASGLVQTIGAFSSNPAEYQQAAAASSVATSVAGVTTLLATNGNMTAASHAARFESLGLFGFKFGLGGSFNPLSATGAAVNGAKEVGAPIGCH